MAHNYATIINKAKRYNLKKIINLYGALGQNIPILKSIIEELTGHKVNIKSYNLDPTLVNMLEINKNN